MSERSPVLEAPPRRITGSTRTGGWLLALSPLGYVAVVAVMVVGFASLDPSKPFSDLSPNDIDAISGAWSMHAIVLSVASVVISVGAVLAALPLVPGPARNTARLAIAAAATALALAVVNAILRITALGSTAHTLGEDASYRFAEQIVWPVGFVAGAMSLVLLATALVTAGRAGRVFGFVVGGIGAIIAVLGIIGAAFVPPFVLGLLAVPVGIRVLRPLR